MPGISGLELVGRRRADPRLCCQRVLICTASNERSVIAQAAALGVRHRIVKPMAKDHVLKQVRRVCGEVTAAVKFDSPARVAARLGADEEHVCTFIKDLQAELEALLASFRAEPGQAGSGLHLKLNSLRGAAINLGVRSLAERLGELEDCCSCGQAICLCAPVLSTLEVGNQRLSRFLGRRSECQPPLESQVAPGSPPVLAACRWPLAECGGTGLIPSGYEEAPSPRVVGAGRRICWRDVLPRLRRPGRRELAGAAADQIPG